jgi:hypothetical protein
VGDNRRILIATIVSMAILFAWQKWMAPPPKPPPAAARKDAAPAPARSG